MHSVDIYKAVTFVYNLFEGLDAYFELRFLRNKEVQQEFYRGVKEIDWEEVANKNRDCYNVFFSVCGRSSKSGKAEAVSVVPALWLDIDNLTKERENEILDLWYVKEVLPIPSYFIRSGHGVHIYWLLAKPVKINRPEDTKSIRGYLYGLANFLHADHCYDLSRVMRLPETINWKYPDAPATCNIWYDHWEDYGIARYPLSVFDEFWLETRLNRTGNIAFTKEPLPTLDVTTLRVSERIKKLIINPPAEGERSEAVFAVVKSMQKAGYTPDEVLSILMNNPIGDRYER